MIKSYIKAIKLLVDYNKIYPILFFIGLLIAILLESFTVIALYPVILSIIKTSNLNNIFILKKFNFSLEQYISIFLGAVIIKTLYLNFFSYLKNMYLFSFHTNISNKLYKNYVSRNLINIISTDSSQIIRNLFNEIANFNSGLNATFIFL